MWCLGLRISSWDTNISKIKPFKIDKVSFKDFLTMLENRKVEDSVTTFIILLGPRIRILSHDKQNQIVIEVL